MVCDTALMKIYDIMNACLQDELVLALANYNWLTLTLVCVCFFFFNTGEQNPH